MQPIEQVSLVDQAAARIRNLMLTGEITPGTMVREEWLQGLLGISRPPIREAIQILVHEGLLERLARRGVRARIFTPRDVWEIYSLRNVLDQYALTLGMPVSDSSLLDAMRLAIHDMRTASAKHNHADYVQANRDFHLALVNLARNSRLTATYVNLMNQMQMLMSINLSRESEQDTEVGVKRHEALLKAIESGDLTKAQAALEAHGELRFLDSEPPADDQQ